MGGFLSHWWHHSNSFPNGIRFLLPLFAWNRIAKVFLLISASVIVLEIFGVERAERWFAERHERFAAQIDWYEIWRLKIVGALAEDLLVLIDFIRHLFTSRPTPENFIRRRPSRPLTIVLWAFLVISAVAASFVSLGTLIVWHIAPFYKLAGAALMFGLTFVCWFLTGLLLLLAAMVGLWLIHNLTLRLLERLAVLGARLMLDWMGNKGVAHTARTVSFALLILGFAMDMLTS